MCGIAGYFGNGNSEKLEKMLNSIKHRGLDDSGIEIFDKVGLGHNRLSIIELSELGHQPMYSHNKDICIVFNGEIYNFKDLKRQLKDKYNFKSNSDTEVIINSYLEWGFDCVKHFNGMFSFVIYDKKKNFLYGARDRLGEKPLKYCLKDNTFVFASEVKAILSFLGDRAVIDPVAIDNYMTFQYVPAPRTGFEGIYKLPPAHYFVYGERGLEINRYWDIDYSDKLDLNESDWEDLIIKELERSVKMRMMSDVPMGALLSGGVDSSAVVAFMSRNSKKRIETFNIGFDDDSFDETPYALDVSRKYNTLHTNIRVSSEDLLNNISNLVDYYDEPIADNSILPTFILAQETKKHITVALNGDGGDENFAGYDRYNIVDFSSKYEDFPAFLRNVGAGFSKMLFNTIPNKFTERAYRFASSFEEPFYRKYVNYNCFFTNEVKKSLYTNEFTRKINSNDSFEEYKNMYKENYSMLDNALNIDLKSYLSGCLLYKTDIASMSCALEFRAPLLDYIFVENMAKMPTNYKIKNGVKKYIFKKALVERGILPEHVVCRKKRGFNIPQNKWFKGPLKQYIYDSILSKSVIEAEIFNEKKLKEYIDLYYKSNLNYDNNIFSLIMVSNWIKRYT